MTQTTQRRVDVGGGIGFDVWTRSVDDPPRVVILGGVHGDESEGVVAAGRLASEPMELKRGTLEVVPICHEAAFAVDSRTNPVDGGNLARVFPGDPKGTDTPRLAHHLFTEVLEGCDLLVDLHTSGRSYDMPVLAGYRGRTRAEPTLARLAAEAFGGDFIWRHPGRSEGRTVSVVDQAIYVECPGGGATDMDLVDHYTAGVHRVLAMMGMIANAPQSSDGVPIRVTGGGNLDSDMANVTTPGLFIRDVEPGEFVSEGQLLGAVVDSHGSTIERIRSASAGHVMAMKARSSVTAGELVVCIAAVDD